MRKIIKYLLILFAGVIAVFIAVAAYIAATFNPNDYKPQIVQLVKDKTQRTLKIDGDIKLSFFPNIGVNLPKLALSEHQSDKEFAAVNSARVSLKLMPLLDKQAIVDEVEVKGLRANIIRYKDGRTNFDDLIGAGEAKRGAKAEAKPGAPQFNIDHVDIENTNLIYTDEGSGAKYTLRDVYLKTGRIANGTPGQIEAAFKVSGNQPKFDLNTQLKTRLTFDLSKQTYWLEALDLALKGEAAGITKLALNATGNVGAKLQSKEFSVDKLKLNVTGVKDKDNLDVSLDAPKINLTQEKFSGDKLVLLAKVSGQNNATAHLTVSALQGTQQAFKTGAINLELDAKQGEQTLKAKLSTPLSGNLKNQQFNLPAIAANFTASGPGLPNKSVSGELKGSAEIDAAKERVQANLSGRLEDSSLKAKL
ncbi:MAG: AsmA family protein, partial [Burkholderiales bacterium]